MNIYELANKSKELSDLQFQRNDKPAVYRFGVSGFIEFAADGRRVDFNRDEMAYGEYQIVCQHPRRMVVEVDTNPDSDLLCKRCGRMVYPDYKERPPVIPEKIYPMKLNKKEQEKEDFLIKYMRPKLPQPFIEPKAVTT